MGEEKSKEMILGHEHRTYTLLKFMDNPDKHTLRNFLRVAIADDKTTTMTGTIPEYGEVTNVPMIALDSETILLVGNSYLAVLELHKDKEVSDEPNS